MSKYFKVYILPSLAMLALAVSFLFIIKNKVANLNKDLNKTNARIIQEKETIHVLKAEYSYLTNPKRIRKLTDKNLNLAAPEKSQIMNAQGFKLYLQSLETSDAKIQPNTIQKVDTMEGLNKNTSPAEVGLEKTYNPVSGKESDRKNLKE